MHPDASDARKNSSLRLFRPCFQHGRLLNSGNGLGRRLLYTAGLHTQHQGRVILNAEHMAIVNRGANALDEWRAEVPGDRLDLSGADLRGRNFAGWNLARALLDGADLSGADLTGTELSEASLRRANLRGACLERAMLYRATLAGSDVRDANFRRANMYRCVLRDCDIRGAEFRGAALQKVLWPRDSGVAPGTGAPT